ncbi:MAG: hypothetical protein K2J02_03880 [Malacoplasma sp.]|nr:hypothetical protein [Malacoplasma sp.]
MKKKLNKKWLFSLFAFPLIASPIGLSTINNSNNSNNSISLVNKSLNLNESTTDENINLEDALPIPDSSISNFGDYIVSYEDNNITPVNITIPLLTTVSGQAEPKAGGATVGMTKNKQTITVTTYAGLLLWSHKLTENQLLKNYYNSVLSVNDISTFKVINFAYLESSNILFILFGQETTASDATTLSNLTVFGLDINSGAIVVPKNAKLSDSQVIAKARDNSAFIFFNTANQLIVTSGDNVADINSSTKIMSFDIENGFANVANKGNDEPTNDFSYNQSDKTTGLNANDMLLGFLPSSISGINYSFWLASTVWGQWNGTFLNYSTSNATTNAPQNNINEDNKWFNYYIIPVNDSFENLTASDIMNRGNKNDVKRGYLLPASDTTLPNFDDITKRFFNTSSVSINGTTTETVGVLVDSYDSMFSTFINYSIDISNNNVTLNSIPNFYFNAGNVNSGPTAAELANLPDNVVVNKWEFNSVGYDKESNFIYLSLSGNEVNVTEGDDQTIIPGKYLTNTRYASLQKANNESKDAYVESSPYTLSDVNLDTYTNQNNLYLTKQVIDGNDGQWLKTTVTDFTNESKDFAPTDESKINFSSLDNLSKSLRESTLLNNVMPSNINSENLSDYLLKESDLSNEFKFVNVEGDDETGIINVETEITYPNNFGDNSDNGSVLYDFYIQAKGFAINDFSLVFEEESDSTVEQFKKDYSAKKIVEENNKGWVYENLLKDFKIKNEDITLTENMITLTNPDDTSLQVEISVPIKSDENDTNGILPVGFPPEQAKKTITYSGFTGTQSPSFIPINPNNPDSGKRMSGGSIAGIVIGCLVVAAILISAVIILRIRAKRIAI